MSNNLLVPNGYRTRLFDPKVEKYLSLFGAVSITGPRFCGKTWIGEAHARSEKLLDVLNTKRIALLDVRMLLEGEYPLLIDEWTLVPELWDIIRRECDKDTEKGKFILTCSTSLSNMEREEMVFHSGAGRFGNIEMHTMSLYESGDSSGKVSLEALKEGKQSSGFDKEITLPDLSYFIIRGGWPRNTNSRKGDEDIFVSEYIKMILSSGYENKKRYNKERMSYVLKSLARNETSYAEESKILSDITEDPNNKEEVSFSRVTLIDYLDFLDRLHLIENQVPYTENIRSRKRIGKTKKRHFCDPSIAASLLSLNSVTLLDDAETFGLLFESLVIHDLRIYIESLGGRIYQFKENTTGLEADAVLEFRGGDYALVEVKLGSLRVDDAIKNLLKVKALMEKPPIFMLVVVGVGNMFYRDKESGVFIAPLTSLKP